MGVTIPRLDRTEHGPCKVGMSRGLRSCTCPCREEVVLEAGKAAAPGFELKGAWQSRSKGPADPEGLGCSP